MKSECAKRQFGFLSDKIKRFPPLTALIKINYSRILNLDLQLHM